MRWLKWIIILLLVGFVAIFLHYTLPGRDIVQIVGTDTKRMDVGSSIFWASPEGQASADGTRDVRFVNTIRENGKPRAYRNEDTGWGWPPYLKFDSQDITAEAQAIAAKQDTWVAITHYGWRLQVFNAFPNILSMKIVDGPQTTLIPWFNIVFFVILAIILFAIYRLIARFKERNIDPVIENVEEMMDDVSESASEAHAQVVETKKSVLSWIKGLFSGGKQA